MLIFLLCSIVLNMVFNQWAGRVTKAKLQRVQPMYATEPALEAKKQAWS